MSLFRCEVLPIPTRSNQEFFCHSNVPSQNSEVKDAAVHHQHHQNPSASLRKHSKSSGFTAHHLMPARRQNRWSFNTRATCISCNENLKSIHGSPCIQWVLRQETDCLTPEDIHSIQHTCYNTSKVDLSEAAMLCSTFGSSKTCLANQEFKHCTPNMSIT